MSYYDDEFDYEGYQPSDELSEKIRELVEEEARNKIKSTFDSLETANKRNEELHKQIQELRAKTRTYEADIKNAFKEGELAGERKIGSLGFAVNDTVYYKRNNFTESPCDKCGKTGRVEVNILGVMKKVDCPHCNYGKIRHDNYVPVSDTVQSLKFWISQAERGNPNSGSVLKEDWDIEVWLKKYDGSMNRKSIYKTLEECQAACDEKNSRKEVLSP